MFSSTVYWASFCAQRSLTAIWRHTRDLQATQARSRKLDWRTLLDTGSDFNSTAYGELLLEARGLGLYPGSALLAMCELPNAELFFCDLDESSIRSLQTAELAHREVRCFQQDGLSKALKDTTALTFIDPFDPNQGSPDSWETFQQLSDRGAAVVLWYPLLSYQDYQQAPEPESLHEIWVKSISP